MSSELEQAVVKPVADHRHDAHLLSLRVFGIQHIPGSWHDCRGGSRQRSVTRVDPAIANPLSQIDPALPIRIGERHEILHVQIFRRLNLQERIVRQPFGRSRAKSAPERGKGSQKGTDS